MTDKEKQEATITEITNDNETTSQKEDTRCEELQNKLDELNDKYLRALAEMENIKKRARADIESGSKSQMIKLATAFFPVIDAIQSALKNATDEQKTGLELVLKTAEEALKSADIEKIETENTEFNPKYHQAITTVSDSEKPKNTIVSELMSGYKLGEMILRPSMVVVAK